MAREVESTHAFLEALAFRIVKIEREGADWLQGLLRLGAEVGHATTHVHRDTLLLFQ